AISTQSGNAATTVTLATYESGNLNNLPWPSMAGNVVTGTDGSPSNAVGCDPLYPNFSQLQVNRYWEITLGTQAAIVANLTFSYLGSENNTMAACGGGAGGLLAPQRWDNVNYAWGTNLAAGAVYGGGTAGVTAGVGTVAIAGISTFSPWTLVIKTNPLPIELLSFQAKINSYNTVNVNWETATETNNAYFTVERSADAKNFEFLDKIPGAGNSSSVLNYGIVDKNPLKGVSYYRLQQTDFDGKTSYSNISEVNFDGEFTFLVYPNPSSASNLPNLEFNSSENHEVLVVLEDVTGHQLYSKIIVVKQNEKNVTVLEGTNQLPKGMYFITATSDNSIYKQKLIIQ
ncbi:MAG TPA: T9SS type A sorting domain-containing protein, partial [Bacteroidia bacterium]|nr:T9SS type A sorting domain-containing protein [Bacteroidia bacterium]